jgi:hypothetical protein
MNLFAVGCFIAFAKLATIYKNFAEAVLSVIHF